MGNTFVSIIDAFQVEPRVSVPVGLRCPKGETLRMLSESGRYVKLVEPDVELPIEHLLWSECVTSSNLSHQLKVIT